MSNEERLQILELENQRLRAENERLRATLVAISDGTVLAMPFAAALAKQCLKWVDTELTS